MFRISSESPRGSQVVTWASLVLVLILGMWVYRDVGSYAFVQFDDPALVSNNPYVNRGLSADSVRWAFTFKESPGRHAEPLARELWAPLSFISLALDVQIAGLDAAFHHRVNLCMHLLGTCLTFIFFLRLTRLPLLAAMVAAVFCIHPMHAESVAWISERKDVLSTLLVLGTLNFYLAWKLRAAGGGRVLWWGALLCFGLACLAKPMAVVTPLLLLSTDAWLDRQRVAGGAEEGSPRQSMPALLRQKLPFLVIMLAAAVAALAMKLAHAPAPTGTCGEPVGQAGGDPLRPVVLPRADSLAPLPICPIRALPSALPDRDLDRGRPDRGDQLGRLVVASACAGMVVRLGLVPDLPAPGDRIRVCRTSFTADRYTYLAHCGLAFAGSSGHWRG